MHGPLAKGTWYVLTGAPSSGKTTLVCALAEHGHLTYPETSRQLIDEGVSRGMTVAQIRHDEHAFHESVARRMVERERGADLTSDAFFDRGLADIVAFARLYDWPVSEDLVAQVREADYRAAFLLDPLPFQRDYARTEDGSVGRRLDILLEESYADAGVPVIRVAVASPAQRLAFILARVAATSNSATGE